MNGRAWAAAAALAAVLSAAPHTAPPPAPPGAVYAYLGKPSATQTVGRRWADLDRSTWTPPVGGAESTFSYLRIRPTFTAGRTTGGLQVRLWRANGDHHAPHTIVVDRGALQANGTMPATFQTVELGARGARTRVQVRAVGGLSSVTLGTRYTIRTVIPVR